MIAENITNFRIYCSPFLKVLFFKILLRLKYFSLLPIKTYLLRAQPEEPSVNENSELVEVVGLNPIARFVGLVTWSFLRFSSRVTQLQAWYHEKSSVRGIPTKVENLQLFFNN